MSEYTSNVRLAFRFFLHALLGGECGFVLGPDRRVASMHLLDPDANQVEAK